MNFIGLLTCSSLIVIGLTTALYLKTRSAIFPVGAAALYFWSLYGGWGVVAELRGAETGLKFDLLEQLMFPLELNRNYYETLVWYSVFVCTALCVALVTCNPARTSYSKPVAVISHGRIICICAAAGFISYLLVRGQITYALLNSLPIYEVTRERASNPFQTYYQLLNRVALVPSAIGLATLVSGPAPRLLDSQKKGIAYIIGYSVLLCGMLVLCFLLGNRNEIVIALLGGILFYAANAQRPNRLALTLGAFAGACILALIGFMRGRAIGAESDGINIWVALGKLLISNEAFAAHFSLYGVFQLHMPVKWGNDLISLAASFVPHFLWPNRPEDIYNYYHNQAGLPDFAGFSIHPAAGWYLNFGFAGIIAGGAATGYLWAYLYNHRQTSSPTRWVSIFRAIAPYTFTAFIPVLMRAGPSGFRSLAIIAFGIPVAILAIASTWPLICERPVARPRDRYAPRAE